MGAASTPQPPRAKGRCTDPGTEKALRDLAGSLIDYLDRHVCPLYTLESMVREEGAATAVAAR